MTRTELAELIGASLTPLAAAREAMLADPEACPPPNADACPGCGGPSRAHRSWAPGGLGGRHRCRDAWHAAGCDCGCGR